MDSLETSIAFVKYQRTRTQKIADKSSNPAASTKLKHILEQFEDTIESMESAQAELIDLRAENDRLRDQIGDREKSLRESLYLSPEEIEGLPEELLGQLSLTETDRQEFEILSLFKKAGGVMSLDKILIALYHHNGEIMERQKLNQRLYRMANKGQLFPVKSRKGIYSLTPIEYEEESQDEDDA